MSREQPFALHKQHVWEERAASQSLPAWLRVAFLAYGKHRANGHANFKRGEVAMVLGGIDPDTGEVKPMARQNVHRAIAAATEAGWLAEGSTSLCLVVPAHAISGGLGKEGERCPIHERRAGKPVRPALRSVSA